MNAVTVIIPTFNRRELLEEAVGSVWAQSVPCDILIVDDASTDGTAMSWGAGRPGVKLIRMLEQSGPAAARNMGLRYSATEFVCFLDDDDVLYPHATEVRLAAIDGVDWCFGDILIREVSGKTERASDRYDYAGKGLPGITNLRPMLDRANFIPVHAPLIRRSVCGRFPEGPLEDWAFLRELSLLPGRFVPHLCGEYRKTRNGRNSQ